MSSKAILADAPHPSTRELRALALYRTRGHEIEKIAEELYLVPSQDGTRMYRVSYGEHESCNCPDHNYRGVNCVHILAVAISKAKRRGEAKTGVCSGCGRRFRHRELTECVEDNHDNLTYFHGDLLCRECADNAGVGY